ncbi:MAG: thioredoxin domain-containing protein [Candidatus Anstonellales archaeon]
MYRYVAILGFLVLLGCIGQSGYDLTDQQKQEIVDIVKSVIAAQTQLSKDAIIINIKNYEIVSDVLKVNLSANIGGQSVDFPVYFTKDLKYIMFGMERVDELRLQLNNLQQPTVGQSLSIPDLSDVPMKGSQNAPIIMIEFSDFECPFCKRFADTTMPQLMQNWIDTGKIRFYYIHFPLNFHPKAEPAARASYCAQKQGIFWEYHDKLFQNIQTIQNNEEGYSKLAEELGLDLEEFKRCYNSQEAALKVQKDTMEGMNQGVSGTPSFLVIIPKELTTLDRVRQAATVVQGQVRENAQYYGIFFSGAYPYAQFNQMLTLLYSS